MTSMQWSRAATHIRGDRFGFLLIASSLLVIALICGLYLRSQLDARTAQNRSDGVSLARVLSSIPYAGLVTGPGRQGPLEVVRTTQGNPDFAYGAVVTLDGSVLAEVTAPGITIPSTALPVEPSAWIGEREAAPTPDGRRVREFLSPVIENGERVAHVRIGFLEPGYEVFLAQASFLGLLALPIFLLTPLAYFLLRRAVRPLSDACVELNDLVQEKRFDTVQLEATGEVGEFIDGFNRFMRLAQSRIEELEQEKTSIVASSKVLAYQKSRVEAVLETLPDATFVLDETGSAIFANAKLEPVLGVSRGDVRGRKLEEWCANPRILALLAKFSGRDGMRSLGESVEIETGLSPDQVVEVEASPLVTSGAADDLVGTLVVVRDVTQESVAKRAHGEFVSHVAHELKSPLNVMSMYGESLLDASGDSEEFRVEASNVIRDEVERLSGLINTLLSIARIETGAVTIERQRIRLQEFLEDAVDAVSRAARDKELSFDVDVPRDIRNIYIDKELFRVAINNLLTNAIKYNRPNGEVHVSVREVADRVAISVRDTGIGIREDDLPQVFDKFFRSEDLEAQKRGGHGLGLSLAREIVELHGGRIRVQTTPGEGSEFSIELRTRSEDRDTG
jgi:PAS domain S-box-containing protein